MKKQILKLREEGKTYTEIQEILGCSKGTISYHCGKGQKEKTLKRQDKKRKQSRQWVIELKKTLKCQNCQEDRWWVLDFHHRDPNEKEGTINFIAKNKSKEKVLKELEKCDVLCANCHRDYHHHNRVD